MAVDKNAFLGREWAGFFQNGVRHPNLADIVQQGGDFDLVEALFGDLHLAGYPQRPFGEACAVHSGIDVFQVEHLVKGANQRVAKREMLLFQFLDVER